VVSSTTLGARTNCNHDVLRSSFLVINLYLLDELRIQAGPRQRSGQFFLGCGKQVSFNMGKFTG
jgi:hypothetical protein